MFIELSLEGSAFPDYLLKVEPSESPRHLTLMTMEGTFFARGHHASVIANFSLPPSVEPSLAHHEMHSHIG